MQYIKLYLNFIHVCLPVAWKNTLEDWAAEDWNEDVGVS